MVISIIKNIRNKLKKLTKSGKKKPDTQDTDIIKPDLAVKEKYNDKKKQVKADFKTQKTKSRKKKKKPVKQTKSLELIKAHKNWDISQFNIPSVNGKTRFHDLDLPGEIVHAVADLGFQYCSPIQAEVLPGTLSGRDASGQAQTGTGKTAAFLITVFTHIINNPIKGKKYSGTPRVLILAPTRELVIQIAEEARLISKYYKSNIVTIFGGMDYQKQRQHLINNVIDIIVATPGRLIDFSQHNDVQLNKVEILIIDEADRMLDMGFIPQVRRLVRATPHKNKRQTLFFSATMTGEVERLASQWTTNPLVIEIEPEQVEVASVEQIVYLVTSNEKFALLYNIILHQDLKRVIIFCNRRDETHRIADLLNRYNINCAIISGEIAQKKRLRTLENFRAGNIRVLVATDVAGRGIHIEGVSHVINYTLPNDPENYVHRIGRTGRAGATGTSISFACEEDSFYIPDIEDFLGHKLPCTEPEKQWLKLPEPPKRKQSKKKPRRKYYRPKKTEKKSGNAHL